MAVGTGLRPAVETLRRAAVGSTAVARELTELDAALRSPVSTSRRVAFVQAAGGAGATTTLATAATLLARRRGGGVLAVDATRGGAALVRLLGTPPLDLTQAGARTTGAVTGSQVRAALPQTPAGVCVVGGAEPAPWPVPPAAWRAAVDPVGRFFDVVLTDWGVRTDDAELAEIADEHHGVVVVARADRTRAEEGLALVARLLPHAPVALLLVDVGGTAGPTDALVRRQTRALGLDLPVLTAPRDPALGSGSRATSTGAQASRTATARIAVGLLRLTGVGA